VCLLEDPQPKSYMPPVSGADRPHCVSGLGNSDYWPAQFGHSDFFSFFSVFILFSFFLLFLFLWDSDYRLRIRVRQFGLSATRDSEQYFYRILAASSSLNYSGDIWAGSYLLPSSTHH
jgi:hypothetical protein